MSYTSSQLTKCMAVEFERRQQHVAAILLHPGTVDTDLSRPFQKVGGRVQREAGLCRTPAGVQERLPGRRRHTTGFAAGI